MDTIPSSITVNLRTSNSSASIYHKSIRVVFMIFLVFIAYLCNSMWANDSIQNTMNTMDTMDTKTSITTTINEPLPEPVPDILEQYYIHHDYGSLTEATDNLFNGPLLRTISQN